VRDPMSLESLPPLRTLFAAHEAAFPLRHIAAACALRTAADCTDATYAGMGACELVGRGLTGTR
jgi:hypothetical protein